MDFDKYQDAALETAIYPGQGTVAGLMYAALGLGSEAGEVQGIAKKLWRDEQDLPFDPLTGLTLYPIDKILNAKKEIGDVLWYAAVFAAELGLSLDECAETNLAKLASRRERGVLGGSGDNR